MTIQSIRVASKEILVAEQFGDFLLDNHKLVTGGLNYANLGNALLFAVDNTKGLSMSIPNCGKDLLYINTYSGMSPRIEVTYLEHDVLDDESMYSACNTVSFDRAKMRDALTHFMTRFNATNPAVDPAPTIKESTTKSITNFLLNHNKPRATPWIANLVDCGYTPESLKQRLTDMRYINRVLLNQRAPLESVFYRGHIDHSSLAVKCSADSLPDVSGMEVVFENGVLVIQDSDRLVTTVAN